MDLKRESSAWRELAKRGISAVERRADAEATTPQAQPTTGANYVPMTVETFDNHIYFYADVDTDRCLDLVRRVREVDNELRRQSASRMLPDDFPAIPIWLHIQSNGGEVFTGLNIADQLQKIKSPIYSIVEGVSASAATLISLACSKRYILPSSFMLIHEVTSHHWGKYSEFEDEKHILDMLMSRLVDFYSSHTKMSPAKVKKLLDRDSWFSAHECVEMGLVDEIF